MPRSITSDPRFLADLRRLHDFVPKTEYAAICAALRALQNAPWDHDGEQPGIGIPGAVRWKVSETRHRLIYRYDREDDRIDMLFIYSVPRL